MKRKLFFTFLTIMSGLTLQAQQPPVACFKGDSMGLGYCTMSFTDLSLYNPTSWAWSFPGGTPSSSTVQNPSNINYPAPGIYDVTLTVSNAWGSDTETKIGVVNVNICYFDTTIGTCDSTVTGIIEEEQEKIRIDIIPHPLIHSSIIKIDGQQKGEIEIVFFDALGRQVKSIATFNKEIEIKRKYFVTGIYFYQVFVADKYVGQGKLIVE